MSTLNLRPKSTDSSPQESLSRMLPETMSFGASCIASTWNGTLNDIAVKRVVLHYGRNPSRFRILLRRARRRFRALSRHHVRRLRVRARFASDGQIFAVHSNLAKAE